MEEVLKEASAYVALMLECVAVVLVVWGALLTVVDGLRHVMEPGWRGKAWVRLGSWLLLALQFALGADIVRSVIAPTWNDIGQLAAIALIRTFLNYFLEKDIEVARHEIEPKA
jgi:uncharacterized membrane protein